MTYINIDTEKGIIGFSTAPRWGDMEPRVGRVAFEAKAKNFQITRENGVSYKDETLYRCEPSEARVVGDTLRVLAFTGHAKNGDWYVGKVIGGWSDSATFDPGTFEEIKIFYADPPTTVVMDGRVIAENVVSYSSGKGMNAGLLVIGAVALGLLGAKKKRGKKK